ncbi:MAG: pyrimidine dimer DNA glycosylase/endonuclease V [Candidatus Gracilibacteria bacterium]|nr:pyrimidine dimer DNA glycosylase/endonuclease V [Candidatus Gracilibacteria bacterium]
MRLWSLHPSYLDRQGLLAVWREGLLAQKVLQNRTKGYKNHPQLIRFRAHPNPIGAIGYYLSEIVTEATKRGYVFDASKIEKCYPVQDIAVTTGQISYEKSHLRRKLLVRNPERIPLLESSPIRLHPSFSLIEGEIEDWEIV